MPDQVPHEVKIERLERLVAVTQETARRRNGARIGRFDEVLVEGRSRTDASLLRGRTRRNTTVIFDGDAAPGSIVEVLVDGATSTTLRGRQRALAAV
jgi:tRNA-2-methylthio-N6-dimethylallyladenosine synthase